MTIPWWVSIIVAVIMASGAVLASRLSRERAKKDSPVDDAVKVSAMAQSLMSDMRADLKIEKEEREAMEERYQGEISKLRNLISQQDKQISSQNHQIAVLTGEVVRLGGDPKTLNGAMK